MTINDLVIDANKSIAGKKILTNITPVYKYENKVKTDQIEGYNYEVVLPFKGFDKIKVKIAGSQAFDMPAEYPQVEFEGLAIKVYAFSGEPRIVVSADAIKIVKQVA